MKKTIFFLAFIVLLSIADNTFDPRFSANFSPDKYYADANTNFASFIAITSGGAPVNDGDYACVGTVLDITTTNTTTFDGSAAASTIVDCPTASCGFDATPTPPPVGAPIQWFSTTAYHVNINTYSVATSWCRYTSPPAPFLTLYTAPCTYRTLTETKGTGVGGTAVFCYGRTEVLDRATVIASPYTLSAVGSHILRADLVVGNCSLFIRSNETGGATKDCIYKDGDLIGYRANSPSVGVNVIKGPNLSIVSYTVKLLDVTIPVGVTPSKAIVEIYDTLSNQLVTTDEIPAGSSKNFAIPNGDTVTVMVYNTNEMLGWANISVSINGASPSVPPGTIVLTGQNVTAPSSFASPSQVQAGNPFNWQFVVNNTGDAPAQILGPGAITLVNATILTITSPVAWPLIIQPNATATISGTALPLAPPPPGQNYDITATITYSSTIAAIGTCDDAQVSNLWLGALYVFTRTGTRLNLVNSAISNSEFCYGEEPGTTIINGTISTIWDDGSVTWEDGISVNVTIINSSGQVYIQYPPIWTISGNWTTGPLTPALWPAGLYLVRVSAYYPPPQNLYLPPQDIGQILIEPADLDVIVTADPVTVLKYDSTYVPPSVTINTTITRCGGRVKTKIGDMNLTIFRIDWDGSTWNWNIQRLRLNLLECPPPDQYRFFNTSIESVQGWPASVYQASVSVWDDLYAQTVQQSAFFVIYQLDCYKKA